MASQLGGRPTKMSEFGPLASQLGGHMRPLGCSPDISFGPLKRFWGTFGCLQTSLDATGAFPGRL